MANHPLISYVGAARERGMTNKQIFDALTGAGWHIHDLTEVLLDHVGTVQVLSAPEDVSPDSIITIRGISKTYGKDIKALEDINLDVKRGTVTALLGPNGAGKTTLIRVLATLLKPDRGLVRIAGLDLARDAQELRSIIGLAGQYAAVDGTLTGRENLEMVARLYHLSPVDAKARAVELLEQFDLVEAADRALKTYSGGMSRRLDLAASLVIRPKILFLDEPTAGLDPRSRFAMWRVIRDLVADDTTVLLTTQYLEEADQLAHAVIVIDHGHIIAQGTAEELKNQVGGDVLELRVADQSQVELAAQLIASFGSEAPRPDLDTGVITMPVVGDRQVLLEVIRQMDNAQIKISDIILRRPSLDDVFLALTGHATNV